MGALERGASSEKMAKGALALALAGLDEEGLGGEGAGAS